ncbi:MAG TPA: MBL fold metallo-hydrolase [Methylomusa anaerophila]|uniref:Putative metallo-hydrolase YflN n=1 Tax=Methylomusa anaerophila TaxID=1930071 RepID=A0A348AEP4_9FIRM|nr:MBL fold metallo-hydrolase [Methylomusa anaerophila]BBB89542.1 putative metallo-hydrolase YflN [Methylomusa anaerophila]HML90088.1 MBL fold metallo-hydrolase [Methylomusa anaerophila]
MKNTDTTLNFKMLTLEHNPFGASAAIYPTLLWDDNGATLVDVGYPGQLKELTTAVEQAGVWLKQIRRIVFTHQDWDHIGNVSDLQDALGNEAEIYTHANERDYIEGVVPYIKMTPQRIEARIQSLPENIREQAAALFANIPTVHVHKTFQDKDVLPFHDGVQVIHTPGHTPGHICLYLRNHRMLIAGDQLRIQDEILVGPAPEHTADMRSALESLRKLQDYDIDYVICYHGGLYGPQASVRIAQLVAEAAS